MEDALSKANRYIKEHRDEVNERYRQAFHLMPPLNWMNDPNGFCFYKGRFHLYYQFNPYENSWGPMHWGHASSDDLLHFQDHPVALAPSIYESHGCFSGTSIINPFSQKEELLIYYASHHEEDGIVREETSLATSIDAIHFEKKGKVITTEMIPPSYSRKDFRDPKAYYEDGYLYLLMATNKEGKGCLLIYRGDSPTYFSFHMEISLEEMGIQAECPDLIRMNDKYLLLFSSIHKEDRSSSHYAVIDLDLKKSRYKKLSSGLLDCGYDYYAPQATAHKGKTYLTGWLESWKEEYDFVKMKQGWNSSLALPREISIIDDKLIQKPLSSFYLHLGEKITNSPIKETGLLSFSLEKDESLILDKDDEERKVEIRRKENGLFVTLRSDSRKVTNTIPYEGGEILLIMDKASLELFLDSGIVASWAHYFKREDIDVEGNFSFQPYLP